MNTKSFRTTQEFVRDVNPKNNNKYITAIDLGYSGTKVFYETGHFCFPSYVKKMDKGMLGISSQEDIFFRENGEIYIVGISALRAVDTNSTNDSDSELFSRKRYSNPLFRILCKTALGLATYYKKDTRDIVIQTGLPSAYVEADTYALKKALSGDFSFELKIGAGKWKKFDLKVKSENIYVMPQPSGSLYSAIIKSDGKYVPDAMAFLSSNVLVCDIGFGTLDLYGIKNRMIECKDSNSDTGMRNVFSKISKEILKDTNEDIRITGLQQCLDTGKFSVLDEEKMESTEISISPYLEKANAEAVNEAIMKIKNITNTFRDYNFLVIGGGTGSAWYDDFTERLAGMKTLKIIPANRNDNFPMIYSNVRGYYLYRYMAL